MDTRRDHPYGRWHALQVVVLLAAAVPGIAAAGDVEVGAALYHQGILPTGEPLRATVQRDVPLVGERAACVNCHGRSGLGLLEGGKVARPVTGALLFKPRDSRWSLRLPTDPGSATTRPAYTETTLFQAIRSGVDPDGRMLDGLMPRYTLGDRELRSLRAYLETLSAEPSPGVDGETLHLATVITPDADPAGRRAVIDVLQAFYAAQRAHTRNEPQRARNSPWAHRWQNAAFRDWQLHVWQLDGSPEEWGEQLDARYHEQPVFALVSGLGNATWQPVHAFCERHAVPCVLPNVTTPPEGTGHWSVYFSRGLPLEAGVIAQHLRQSNPDGETILQAYRKGSVGETAAAALRTTLHKEPGYSVIDRELPADSTVIPPGLFQEEWPVVLWLDDDELHQGMADIEPASGANCRVYLSSTLTGAPHRPLPDVLARTACFVHPFAAGAEYRGRIERATAWLAARGISDEEPRLKADTLFAATLVGRALRHLRSLYHREYFLERIEHITDSAIPGYSYPLLTLGTGQRYASRGGYIVRLTGPDPVPISDWLVAEPVPIRSPG